VLIIRRSELLYTASGITPIGGRLVHRFSVLVFFAQKYTNVNPLTLQRGGI